jgi:uncharacterized protein involved in outer membrane biogenesis
MTLKKKVLIGFLGLVALLTVALAAIPFLVDANHIKSLLVPELEKSLNRKIAVQTAELTVLSGLGVRLKQAVIFEDPQFGPTPFLKVDALRVRLKLLPLLSGKVEVGSIQIASPSFSLIKNRSGIWNFETLGPSDRSSKEKKPSAGQAPTQVELSVSSLEFRNGTITILDHSKTPAGKESRYDQIDLLLEDLSPTIPGHFSLQVRLPASGSQSLKAEGRFGPMIPENFAKTPVEGKIEFTEVPVTDLLALAGSTAPDEMEWRGTLSTKMVVKGNLSERIHLEGTTRFTGLGSKRGNMESPEISGELYSQLDYQMSTSALQIANLRMNLPSGAIQLMGDASGMRDTTRIQLHLNSEGVSIEDLLKLASALGNGPPKGVEASGQARMNLAIGGTFKSPEVSGQARLDSFRVRYPGLREPIIVSPWDLHFERGAMTSNQIQISVGDRTRLQVQPAAVFQPVPQIRTTLSSQNPIPVGDLMAIATTFGAALPKGVLLDDGTVALQLDATKRLDESGQLSINGQASIAGSRLRTPALASPLEIRKASLKFTGNSVSFTDLTAGLGSSSLQGTLQLLNFSSPELVFTLNIDQLDLAALDRLIQTGTPTPARSRAALQINQSGRPASFLPFVPGQIFAAPPKQLTPPPDPLAKLVIRDSRVTIRTVTHDTLVFKEVTSRVQMKGKILELPDLRFRINQGIHSGWAKFDFRGKLPSYSFASKLKDVDVNEFLTQNTSLKNIIYGLLSLDTDLRGNGSSFEEITRNLKGDGKINLLKGRIASFNLSQQIASLSKLFGFDAVQGGTEINELAGTFQVAAGRVSTNDLRLRTPTGNVQALGSFGLDQSLDFQLQSELPASVSRKYNNVNPLLNLASATFFRNEAGNIVLPMRMTGTIGSPRFSLDAKIVQDNLKKRGLNQAMDSIQNLFKKKVAGDTSGSQPNEGKQTTEKPAEKKATPLEDLLKGITDKMKEKKKN